MTSDRPAPDNIMTARGLTLRRDGTTLLDSVSVHIRRGSITLLLGHNGAGKTLLLNCLHGLINCDAGTISGPPLAQQKMVFQKPIITRRTTGGHLRFLCPHLDDGAIREWLRHAEIDRREDAPARMLSGGEQQKLALIGALAARPDILFLDEPTAHLDFAATEFVETMVRQAHEDGMTIVMTSHNRAQAERLGEDVLLLDSGSIVETAPADRFFSAPSHPLARQYLAHL
ncbi:MAG: ATP-binding cassette domain-containing protein [Candidatus Puniceispirillaceae bacterium]|jgi:tungstate transport system ATP-binding protein